MSIGANLTYFAIQGFPHDAVVDTIAGWLSCIAMFSLAFTLGLRAVINETKRKHFHHVVTTYTNMTGDKRYVPYLLPVRAQLVTAVFTISMIISFLLPFVDMTSHAK